MSVDYQAVVKAVEAGRTGADVGREFGISRERVRQIYSQQTGRHLSHTWSGRYYPRPPRPPREAPPFWSRVQFGEGCWIWLGTISTNGYGSYRHGMAAYKFAYVSTKGPVPPGLEIDHLCMNRACVRPDHMEAVTRSVNVKRGIEARRRGRPLV